MLTIIVHLHLLCDDLCPIIIILVMHDHFLNYTLLNHTRLIAWRGGILWGCPRVYWSDLPSTDHASCLCWVQVQSGVKVLNKGGRNLKTSVSSLNPSFDAINKNTSICKMNLCPQLINNDLKLMSDQHN